MRLTPLDIRKQEFKKAMRGLDADEVYAFLSTIADEYEAVLNDNKALRERLLELDDKVQEYRNMERTLRDTLLTAERVTVEAKDNARREAELIVKQAELEADQGVRHIKESAMNLRQEIQLLKRQRESYLSRMKMLAESHMKFLESAETDFEHEEKNIETETTEWQSRRREAAQPENRTPHIDDVTVERSSASVTPIAEPSPRTTVDTTPLNAPLPTIPGNTPSTDTRAATESLAEGMNGDQDVAVAVSDEPTPTARLNELLDRVIKGHETSAEAPLPEATTNIDPERSGEPIATPFDEPRLETSPEPAMAKPSIAEPDAKQPSEWSLEKLKRDILAGRLGQDEDS